MTRQRLNAAILAIVSLCVQQGTAKAEVILCPIETATVTSGAGRIVCGNESDLKRVGGMRDRYRVERDTAIKVADQNLSLWKECRIKLDASRSATFAAQDRSRAERNLALTPVIPSQSDSGAAPYIVGGVIGVVLGIGASVAVALLLH